MTVGTIRKILYLVPDAIFRNYDDEVVEWLDQRSQPTQTQLDAVTDQQVLDKEGALDAQIESEKTALPTWTQVVAAIDNAFTDTAQANIIKKIARPVYTHLKNSVN